MLDVQPVMMSSSVNMHAAEPLCFAVVKFILLFSRTFKHATILCDTNIQRSWLHSTESAIFIPICRVLVARKARNGTKSIGQLGSVACANHIRASKHKSYVKI